MTTDEKEVVLALRANLAQRVGQDRYELWFGATTQVRVRDCVVTVVAPNQFLQNWLRNNFRDDLEACCLATLGQLHALEFHVDTQMPKALPLQPQALPCEPQALPSQQQAPQPLAPPSPSLSICGPAPRPNRGQDGKLPRRPFHSLSSFVVGNTNSVAHTSAQLAAGSPGKFSPLFLYGPTGVGKTHLLEGIWSSFRSAHQMSRAIYLTAEQFTSYFLEALRGTGLPNFRRKYRDIELLLIDDVQFFAGKKATLVELLHTVETLSRAGRQLVFAADRPPSALTALGPELTARFAGGMVCPIEPPEFQTRLGIARSLAAELSFSAPESVLTYVATHFTAHARELAGALKRLQAASLSLGQPIDERLAEECLAELIQHSGRVVRLPDIEKAVCEVCGLEPDSLHGKDKGRAASHPRMLAMWLARRHTRAALSEIGRYFGGRKHTTVISAQKKIASLMAEGSSLNLSDRNWKVEEIVRRVEQRLRAG